MKLKNVQSESRFRERKKNGRKLLEQLNRCSQRLGSGKMGETGQG
jgi:hypothetical protein